MLFIVDFSGEIDGVDLWNDDMKLMAVVQVVMNKIWWKLWLVTNTVTSMQLMTLYTPLPKQKTCFCHDESLPCIQGDYYENTRWLNKNSYLQG